MRNADYWQSRFADLEKAQNVDSAKFYKDVERLYNKAIKGVNSDLSYWYNRFAKSEGITLAEAKKILNANELKEFRMTVEEYIKKGASKDPAFAKELERASTKVHISRLDALKTQMQMQVQELTGNVADGLEKHATSIYNDQYYRTAFELQKGIGVGWTMHALDKGTVKTLIGKPWAADGKNFSDRIWDNGRKLVNELHSTLTTSIARGEDPQKAIDAISKKLEVSKSQAGRVVMTESAFFSSEAHKKAFKDLDVEKYEIVATLDSRTSEICRDMDGKIFELKDMKSGETAPPFHPYCRSTTVPYFDDGEEGFRASRGDDNQYYVVPETMKYREWRDTFVDGISSYDDKLKEQLKPVETVKPQAFADAIAAFKEQYQQAETIEEKETVLKRAGARVIDEINSKAELIDLDAMEAKQKKLRDDWRKADSDDPKSKELWEIYNKFSNEYYKALNDLPYTCSEKIKGVLRKVRKLGLGDINDAEVIYKSKSTVRPPVIQALDCYPTEWIELSKNNGTLEVKKVKRGYYSPNEKLIAISGLGSNGFRTAVHELGHRFEDVIPEILEHEKAFYERRTKGEPLEWMGAPYSKREVTRKDNFLHPYMGKDYQGYAYELVSMGFQYAFTEPQKLMKDPDMAQFIYGLLALR